MNRSPLPSPLEMLVIVSRMNAGACPSRQWEPITNAARSVIPTPTFMCQLAYLSGLHATNLLANVLGSSIQGPFVLSLRPHRNLRPR